VKIAIIGSGNAGRALAGSFVRAGHQVSLAARDQEELVEIAAAVGASAASSSSDAVMAAEVVVIAVPFAASGEAVAREIAPVIGDKVVVDATNPVKPTYDGLVTEGGPSAAELFAAWLPGARVVKAFNTLFASIHADPAASGLAPDGFLAGDDAQAVATVAELLRSIGLKPIEVGGLSAARQLEAMAWLNISLQMRYGLGWTSYWQLSGLPGDATLLSHTEAGVA
jgi:predicted dinucleotide-binding enzyme